jgi:dCMP deaminase
MDIKEFAHQTEGWDKYFYDLAQAVAQNSKCLSRKIGVVIVRDKSVISTGYNGPPAGVQHCNERIFDHGSSIDPLEKEIPVGKMIDPNDVKGKCPRQVLGYKSGEGMNLCPAGHAERNAISNAAKMGVNTAGTTMYMTCPIPCKDCLGVIIGAGINEMVVSKFLYYDDMSRYILDGSDIYMRTYTHLES